MRHRQAILTLVLFATLALLPVACGGGGSGTSSPRDLSEVPTATLPDATPEALIVAAADVPVSGDTYTVQEGDSLSAIADRFGVSTAAIAAANGINDPRSIVAGQLLTIPGATSQPTAEVLGATATPRLTPTPRRQSRSNVYVVKDGDYPGSIAEQFGITAEALMAANGIVDPTDLYVGQELTIPTPAPTAIPQ